ncbi:MAG: hypothetical protein AAF660_03040 [Pseudomonadota bacterium]
MNAATASLINAIVLIAVSAWAYFTSDTPSITALIPGFFGVLLIACFPGVKAENKIVAHIAAVLTLLLIVALFMPLRGALGRDDMEAVLRVSIMLAATLFAMTMFVKSFIDVRRAREKAEQGG